MLMNPLLLPALIVSAALAIAAAPWALDLPVLAWVFKPLATMIVIAHAWQRGHDRPTVRRWVLVGLVWSLVGDVALLWPKRGFLPGLVSFLLAHMAYLVAFTRGLRLAQRPGSFVVYAAIAAVILALLWPGVPGALRAPVVVYVVALSAMAAQAALLWRSGAARGAVVALGGALFMGSDTLLAINKFMLPLPAASLWILATYWAAQWCIASWPAPAERRP